MIVTTTRHGRTARDARYLLSHLSRQDGQTSRVVAIAAPVISEADALAYMQALRDGSRAEVAFHHISLSPSGPLNDRQREEAVARVLSAMGAEDHAHVVWEHSGKPRRGGDIDTHYHIVLAHVGPDGRALDDGRSYVRLEAAARSLEADFGHALTASRRTEAVASELERAGRADVATRIRAGQPQEPPHSAVSSRQRARADRAGMHLPDVRDAVRRAWTSSDSPAAFRSALAEHGLGISAGDRTGVWIVTDRKGQTLGALDRLVREKRHAVAARMIEEVPNDRADPSSHESLEGGSHRSARRAGSGREAGASPVATRSTGRGRGFATGSRDGAAGGDRPEPERDARRDRASEREHRRARGETALAARRLARVGWTSAGRRARWTLHRNVRPRGRDALAAYRLSRVDLDEIRRMAEEFGRRMAAMLFRLPQRQSTAEELKARIRAVSTLPSTKRASGKPVQRDSSTSATLDPSENGPTYRPRMQ